VGTPWLLVAYADGDSWRSATPGALVTAVFDPDGRVIGLAGCHSYRAAYRVEGSTIRVGPAARTRLSCPASEPLDDEAAFLAALDQARSYAIQGNRLELLSGTGVAVAAFTG
jgi:heat shock protein HslJ